MNTIHTINPVILDWISRDWSLSEKEDVRRINQKGRKAYLADIILYTLSLAFGVGFPFYGEYNPIITVMCLSAGIVTIYWLMMTIERWKSSWLKWTIACRQAETFYWAFDLIPHESVSLSYNRLMDQVGRELMIHMRHVAASTGEAQRKACQVLRDKYFIAQACLPDVDSRYSYHALCEKTCSAFDPSI